ncbi:hypothetical protein [Leptospira yasudae]|uniref:hypothetical protein n=1 Tax=Leptospira yasudae TaxID=2202201 RepID=UPI0031344731
MSGAYSLQAFRTTPNPHSHPFLRNVLGAEISAAPVRSGKLQYLPSPSLPSSPKSKSLIAKNRLNLRFPHLNTDYYTQIIKNLLSTLYPKNCPTCKIPLSKEISTRENVISWMERYNKNFRSINHSACVKDGKRNVRARNRWSGDGVHNQVSEGNQRIIQHSFIASCSYIRPENRILYLNEYSALKGLRVFGLKTRWKEKDREIAKCREGICSLNFA